MTSNNSLRKFFEPKSVAIIGATPKEGKVGRVILENFINRFSGHIYPVNPGYEEIFGLKCYKSVLELPETPDLAVIAIPAPGVPSVLRDLGEKGTKAAIIISGGFRETGTPEGEKLENEILEISRKYSIRIIGPNCIGIFDNWSGVDTFFVSKMKRPPKGYIAFVSQSGAFATALIDWMAYHGIGVSRAISYGNKVDVDEIELLEYLSKDENTKVILMYLEGLKTNRGKEFIRIIKEISVHKPVIIYKAGKTERGGKAAASHTAAMAGNYLLYKTAFKQANAIEAESFDEMMDYSRILIDQPLMKGRRVYIVTDAGGVGVMLTDALVSVGLEVPNTPEDLRTALQNTLPRHCIIDNPIDLTGDADDERYINVLEVLLPRNDVDAVVVVPLPQIPGLRGTLIDYLIEAKKKYEKPIVSLIIGSEIAYDYKRKLEENHITTFESPERLAKALKALYTYSNIKSHK
ncbi:MAG: CoA-binding protein [Desulfurococcaceae archaeon]